MSDMQLDELTAAMKAAGMNIAGPNMGLPEEIPAEPLSADDLADLEASLHVQEMKQEVYAGQTSEVSLDDAALTPERSEPKKRGRKLGSGTKAAKAPQPQTEKPEPKEKAIREARFKNGAGSYVAAVAGDEKLIAIVDGMPKKVKEKAANLMEHIKNGKALSVYTKTAVDLLRDKGVMTQADLVAAFQSQSKKLGGTGYSLGTARSQAGQQMAMLTRLGVVKLNGKGATVDADNHFAQALKLEGAAS